MAKNIFLDQLNNNELMSAFGAQEDNAPLTPEELAQLSMQAPEVVVPQAAPIVAPKIDTQKSTKSSTTPKAPAPPAKDDTDDTKTTMSKSEALIAEYQKMLGKDQQSLEDARSRDRMLKVGGSIGDALATYLNAQGQMNVKAPGVQVQQGAGLGKVADMFATAPEIQSDVKDKREALLKQYAELAKGERAQARLTSEEVRARDTDLRARELAKMQVEGSLKAAEIKASGKGELTPYQKTMEDRYQEKEAKLSDKQTSELEGLSNVMRSLDEVETAKSGVNTGRYAAALQAGKDIIPGMEADQDFVKLRQLSGTQLFDYVKAQSGVSYSVKELQQLKNNMPNEDDDDNTFMTKLNTVRGIVERKQQEKLKALGGQGKDISGFKQEQPAKKASDNTQTSNLVRIKGPSGQEATVTEEKAKKYLSKPGYTRIE